MKLLELAEVALVAGAATGGEERAEGWDKEGRLEASREAEVDGAAEVVKPPTNCERCWRRCGAGATAAACGWRWPGSAEVPPLSWASVR